MIAICRLCGIQVSDSQPDECVGWLALATGPREVPLFQVVHGETPPLRLCSGCVGFTAMATENLKAGQMVTMVYDPAGVQEFQAKKYTMFNPPDDPILDD